MHCRGGDPTSATCQCLGRQVSGVPPRDPRPPFVSVASSEVPSGASTLEVDRCRSVVGTGSMSLGCMDARLLPRCNRLRLNCTEELTPTGRLPPQLTLYSVPAPYKTRHRITDATYISRVQLTSSEQSPRCVQPWQPSGKQARSFALAATMRVYTVFFATSCRAVGDRHSTGLLTPSPGTTSLN